MIIVDNVLKYIKNCRGTYRFDRNVIIRNNEFKKYYVLEKNILNVMKNKVINAYRKYLTHGIGLDPKIEPYSLRVLFVELFGVFPHCFESDCGWLYGRECLDIFKTSENIYQEILNNSEYYYYVYNNKLCVFGPDFIIDLDFKNIFTIYTTKMLDCIDDLPDIIKNNVVIEEKNTASYYYVTHCNGRFNSHKFNLKNIEYDIENNYNDNIEHEKISQFLNMDNEPGLVIFHGLPGTGKSYYIRYLMSTIEKNFYIIDPNLFNYIDSNEFIEFLMERKNSIFVLEDCESLLISRNNITNSKLTTLLNLTDGILGDVFNLKFICTFNTDLTNIDNALLRKGRLKVKNFFDELTENKVKILESKLGIKTDSNLLTDIYNNLDTSYIERKNKIGFTA